MCSFVSFVSQKLSSKTNCYFFSLAAQEDYDSRPDATLPLQFLSVILLMGLRGFRVSSNSTPNTTNGVSLSVVHPSVFFINYFYVCLFVNNQFFEIIFMRIVSFTNILLKISQFTRKTMTWKTLWLFNAKVSSMWIQTKDFLWSCFNNPTPPLSDSTCPTNFAQQIIALHLVNTIKNTW